MKWTSNQVEEIAAIKNYERWVISDLDGILVKGFSSAMMVNALTACLSNGYHIDNYVRSFTDGVLRIFIEE